MRIAVFSTKRYDQTFLQAANAVYDHQLVFFEPRLTYATSALAEGFEAVCVFVNDQLDEPVLRSLHNHGIQVVALRCAGSTTSTWSPPANWESVLCVCRPIHHTPSPNTPSA